MTRNKDHFKFKKRKQKSSVILELHVYRKIESLQNKIESIGNCPYDHSRMLCHVLKQNLIFKLKIILLKLFVHF